MSGNQTEEDPVYELVDTWQSIDEFNQNQFCSKEWNYDHTKTSTGKIQDESCRLNQDKVDFLSISGHKHAM
tara:strand:- start:612 stop:824 length:213 start_codon:yes stop_codon:yes gene_type:complete